MLSTKAITKLTKETLYMQNSKVLLMQRLIIQQGGCSCQVGRRGDQRKGKTSSAWVGHQTQDTNSNRSNVIVFVTDMVSQYLMPATQNQIRIQ